MSDTTDAPRLAPSQHELELRGAMFERPIWSREHFGPSVGRPPAAMYTSLRYPLAVELGSEPLGDFSIALCGLRFDAGEPWLEGRPLPIDVEVDVEPSWPTFADGAVWLEAAIAALRPWHSPPVGRALPRER